MKTVIAAILIILIGLQSVQSLAVYSIFLANQDYIAAVLCEKKDEPESACKGKCYLKKQMKKTGEDEEQHNRQRVKEIEPPIYLITSPLSLAPAAEQMFVHHYSPARANHYNFQFLSAFLRPPCS